VNELKESNMPTVKKSLKVIAVAGSLAVLIFLVVLISVIAPVSFKEHWKEIHIPDGSSFNKGLRILQDNGIIEGKFGLLILAKMTGTDTQLKPGYYSLSASMSPLQIFDDLIQGRTIQYIITIPEGSSLNDIKKILLDNKLMDEASWQLVENKDFLALLNINAPSLEGYIFPDTYKFPKGMDAKIIFKIMVQRLKDILDESLNARISELGMTENEALTLASIIEKEAIFDRERPLISSVFHNRLKKNMRLQADPTVLYGVKTKRKRILYRDLRRKTPYNTYKIKGLPPGPIASPGEKSIRAALYPAAADYLFFVSRNNGTHHFSSTNEEHWEAVVRYQRDGVDKKSNDKKKTD
jgi:UPF0755 protein